MPFQACRWFGVFSRFRMVCAGFGLLALAGCQTGSGDTVGGAPAVSAARPSPATALSPDQQSFERARQAFGSGDYKTSFRLATDLAAKGFGPAYNLLHFFYARGYVVEIDRQKAVEWLKKGVAAGDDKAEGSLGNWYRLGTNVEKDYDKALELLRRSAAKGNAVGKSRLATMYRLGQGVAKDVSKARALEREVYEQIRAEAESGDLQALYRQGLYLVSGRGTPRDRDAGIAAVKRAANGGSMFAMSWLARQYFRGRILPRDPEREVFWHRKLAAAGSPSAQMNLAFRHMTGSGVEKDENRAAELMRSAANQGLRVAAHRLSRLLLTGKEIRRDPVEAAFWSRRSAERGYIPSMVVYAYLLETGTGIARDFAAARSWYEKALAKGRRDVNDRLGRLYLYGNGVAQDPARALRYLEESLKVLRPGARKVRAAWLREVAITRLTPEQVTDLKADGFLGDVSGGSIGKESSNLTAAVIERLSQDAPEKLVPLLSDTLKHLAPGSKATKHTTLMLRSVAHYRAGRYREALADADSGMSLGLTRAVDFAHRGSIHFKLENYADARSDFTSAIRLKPDRADYYVSRAFAQIRTKKRDNLIAGFLDFRKAFDLDPANQKLRPLFDRLGFFKTSI